MNTFVSTVAQPDEPEFYTRIQVTQNSRGFQYESTVSVRWRADQMDDHGAAELLARLNRQAAGIAEAEIALRQAVAGDGERDRDRDREFAREG